ncbi:MAG: protein-methionine-sulfoxide reductase heme-binding subunit MsrQ [Gemmatimonadales bacterium]|nr:protein-methionine-sulfoxide reductase heme-binding subunit MsrQ [Gemmatimonadales bacterium]
MTRGAIVGRFLWPACFAAALGPACWLGWAAFGGGSLGADPVKTLQTTTGLAAIVLLLATLGISPLRRLTGWAELIRLRRMLGLWSFAYVLLHAVIYFVFDQSLDPSLIWSDTVEHPRIAVGFAAFLLLIPLALTSTTAMIRRLGRRWGVLHRLVYPATGLALLHYLMVQKLDWRVGTWYVAVFTILMLLRLVRRSAPGRPAAAG